MSVAPSDRSAPAVAARPPSGEEAGEPAAPATAPPGEVPDSVETAAAAAEVEATTADSGAPVVVRDATRRFGDLTAVADLSLEVPAGTILGLIGPSGSGKTTTLRLLTGALAPDSGTVRVLGEDPRRFRRRTRERIGYSPQQFVLYPDLTAGENIDFVAALFGMLLVRRRARVRKVLRLLDLWDARGRRASQLSGGMQRRLELACALVHEPELLFLDEPTAGIDPLLRRTIWEELRRLRDDGRTLLVTTQYVTEAEYCDRVALVSEGRLIAHGTPEDLRRLALGGEVIEIDTERAFDAESLPPIEGVRDVRQHGARDLLVIADDAGAATPRVADAIEAAGGVVVASREYRPTFDEVFAELIARHRSETGRKGSAEGPISAHEAGKAGR